MHTQGITSAHTDMPTTVDTFAHPVPLQPALFKIYLFNFVIKKLDNFVQDLEGTRRLSKGCCLALGIPASVWRPAPSWRASLSVQVNWLGISLCFLFLLLFSESWVEAAGGEACPAQAARPHLPGQSPRQRPSAWTGSPKVSSSHLRKGHFLFYFLTSHL